MSRLFGGNQQLPPLPEPKKIRMPTPEDPNILEAAKRTRQYMLARRGRLSTIMTDNLQNRDVNMVGSTGKYLGS